MIGKVHLKIGGGGLSTAPIYSVIWLIFCRHSLLSPFYEAGDTFASDSETDSGMIDIDLNLLIPASRSSQGLPRLSVMQEREIHRYHIVLLAL